MRDGAIRHAVEEKLGRVRDGIEFDVQVVPGVAAGQQHIRRNVAGDAPTRDGAAAVPTGKVVSAGVVEGDVPEEIARAGAFADLDLGGDETVGTGAIDHARRADKAATADDF